jgi:hypothetical protein
VARIAGGLPQEHFVRAVRKDPERQLDAVDWLHSILSNETWKETKYQVRTTVT